MIGIAFKKKIMINTTVVPCVVVFMNTAAHKLKAIVTSLLDTQKWHNEIHPCVSTKYEALKRGACQNLLTLLSL